MLDNNTIVKVRNRDSGTVGYKIADSGIIRHFAPKETKDITMQELRQLSFQSGGRYILKHYLVLNNKEAVEELIGEVEPEYFFNEDAIRSMLNGYDNNSLLRLMDCLDFAPEGVIDMIKKLAVELEIPDVRKREAIQKSTGFNVSTAISIKKEIEAEEAANNQQKRIRRLAEDAPIEAAAPAQPTRRISIVQPVVDSPKE